MYEVLQYIDGKLTAGAPGRSQDINDPARGEMIGRVRLASREDVDGMSCGATTSARANSSSKCSIVGVNLD